MGVEGRDRARTMDMGAHALSGQLGKTIQRLRKAYNLSLSELAELDALPELDALVKLAELAEAAAGAAAECVMRAEMRVPDVDVDVGRAPNLEHLGAGAISADWMIKLLSVRALVSRPAPY